MQNPLKYYFKKLKIFFDNKNKIYIYYVLTIKVYLISINIILVNLWKIKRANEKVLCLPTYFDFRLLGLCVKSNRDRTFLIISRHFKAENGLKTLRNRRKRFLWLFKKIWNSERLAIKCHLNLKKNQNLIFSFSSWA